MKKKEILKWLKIIMIFLLGAIFGEIYMAFGFIPAYIDILKQCIN